ncbi:hypothetical protein MtrunA17_Chr1g0177691 [Medicago truncatula]|uniref:DUF7138 domain-containing protein n=1 Tax=Medicago truncatula TaxID=3880 RepID=A0A072VV22_MEDTR|nr:uncharacterized protein LOC25483730 [Medicago truncatula]KEH41925.1 hypothetical protein MTR_1g057600 [Medicago truncatula]RHN79471.1 hypothetical protein MtrunA17_Chr1g0177691 [Medicago truncatula]
MSDCGRKPFPVVYNDGETETNLGIITVYPTMNIKTLLSKLSHKIGILPHQFSVFIADQNSDRKIPFTTKVNIPAVACEDATYAFYVSRCGSYKKALVKKNNNLSEKKMLQCRDDGSRPVSAAEALVFERGEMERRMLKFKMEREAFLMRMGNKVESFRVEPPMDNGGGSRGGSGVYCKECVMAEVIRTKADFHLCIRDEVIIGFKTSVGPICRPVRNSDEDGH